mmetsp:Transcript_46280/g.110123  ORF Transcript_46280/g.110123 Transcript_46280/m.110123 type:complete len:869 (+) Transcript_46280:185-2791(+)
MNGLCPSLTDMSLRDLQVRSVLERHGEADLCVPSEEAQCSAKICEKGGSGLLLPLFGDAEQDWPKGVRIPLYLLGLLWTFLAVAIVSDVFMGAIEKIVSKKKRLLNKKTGKYFTYIVWNSTIANLTLMALGSSAPEILLGVIEVAGNEFYAGDLGPSTIVGSAAFNLFCISAVCVAAFPTGEIRFIKDLSVFGVTACFSVFAYLWLWCIVSLSSKNVIDMWESVVTLIFFPILVGLAFVADKGYLQVTKPKKPHLVADIHDLSKEELAEIDAQIKHEHKERLTDEQIAKIIESKLHAPKSRAAYRVSAIRNMTGAHKVHRAHSKEHHHVDPAKVMPIDDTKPPEEPTATPMVMVAVQFVSKSHVVMESDGKVHVPIELIVHPETTLKGTVSVTVKSRDGNAKAGDDFTAVDEVLTFNPGEFEKSIVVEILDDEGQEKDEEFYVDLHSVQYSGNDEVDVHLGEVTSTSVLILDDDGPGTVMFEKEELTIQEGLEDMVVDILVQRKGGFGKGVSCKYMTEDDTALAERDYNHVEGEVTFDQGQVYFKIPITILARGRYESVEHFRLILSDPQGGMIFNEKTDGGSECCIITINIEPAEVEKQHIDRIAHLLSMNWDFAEIGHSNWKQQFVEAVFVNGGDDDEGEAPPSIMDYIMHVIALPWKVLFACIPPSDYCDGWLCFCMALVMIGAVTALIGDLAGLLGCTMGLPDAITAITFVALGTSLPDTFASKTAAVQDEYADASIGNITGSNSVNVFLGIGLSWTAGSVFWASKGWTKEWCLKYRDECIDFPDGGKFIVIGGDLGTSVIVFCCCAGVCLTALMLRRMQFGGELGGPRPMQYVSAVFFVTLWLTYVGISAIVNVRSQDDDPCS